MDFSAYFSPDAALQFGICVLVFLAFFAISRLFRYKMAPLLAKLFKKINRSFLHNLVESISRPFSNAIAWAGAQIALERLSHSAYFLASVPFMAIFRIGYVVFIVQALWNLVPLVPVLLQREDKNAKSIQKLVHISLRVLVISFAVVIGLGELGYNVNGLIAGLGLGGLTLSLAAQNTASNLFAGAMLFTERPFELGDWISCAGVEGTVEDIGLRATKLRTFANTLVVVPNTTICSQNIDNYTRMNMRLKQFTLGICYNTPQEKIEQLIDQLRTLICSDPDVAADKVQVSLFGFGSSSIDIRVVYYTTVTAYADWLAVTQRLNFALLALMNRLGVEFAYPSQSIYLQQPETDANKAAL